MAPKILRNTQFDTTTNNGRSILPKIISGQNLTIQPYYFTTAQAGPPHWRLSAGYRHFMPATPSC
jgi:hypothetical protein